MDTHDTALLLRLVGSIDGSLKRIADAMEKANSYQVRGLESADDWNVFDITHEEIND